MADPFEVRMRFTKQLQYLNASVTATQKAAQYALRYKDMDEDLHSCIVEQLEQVCDPLGSSSRFSFLFVQRRLLALDFGNGVCGLLGTSADVSRTGT